MLLVTGSPHLVACGGPCRHAFKARRVGPVGVLEPGIGASGLPRNLGDPAAPSRQQWAWEQPNPKAPGPRVGVGPYGRNEHRRTGWYCQPKDNEGRQEGPQGVGTPHSTAETGEPAPRGPREGKGASDWVLLEGNMTETLSSKIVYTGQQRIAELAQRAPQMGLTSLNHFLGRSWFYEAFLATRRNGAVGVDGQTWAEYSTNLQTNLQSLEDRAKSGTYRAPPVRRVRIPKGTGNETRPIGIPTVEEKGLQRAVVMALEPIYEQDFLDCSYGFRPGRSAHQALEALWKQAMALGGCWLVEVDIREFFDTLGHSHLRSFLRQRLRDGVLTRLIGKWLQ